MLNISDFTKTINYCGPKLLGEFEFLKAKTFLSKCNKFFGVDIHLQTLYGFHILNSFTPSLLILLISYASLFFPIPDFNERVMVSLIALLVLAAFFTQASNASVRTPYFKLLDIWYVVLIFYCFIIVMFNAVLHKMYSDQIWNEKRNKVTHTVDWDSNNEESMDGKVPKRIISINFMMKIVFTLSLMVFIMIYSLWAANVF